MKVLGAIVDSDPSLLQKEQLQDAVHARFKDTSAMVREAAAGALPASTWWGSTCAAATCRPPGPVLPSPPRPVRR